MREGNLRGLVSLLCLALISASALGCAEHKPTNRELAAAAPTSGGAETHTDSVYAAAPPPGNLGVPHTSAATAGTPDFSQPSPSEAGATAASETQLSEGELAALKDRQITERIRESLVSQDDLSFTAKNVKVVTEAGQVTLRGSVPNSRDRVAVGSVARDVAGEEHVVNQVEVRDH